MAEKVTYKVGIHGCDDSTYLIVDLTAEEAALVERLAAMSKEESAYGCMPTMAIEKHIESKAA